MTTGQPSTWTQLVPTALLSGHGYMSRGGEGDASRVKPLAFRVCALCPLAFLTLSRAEVLPVYAQLQGPLKETTPIHFPVVCWELEHLNGCE